MALPIIADTIRASINFHCANGHHAAMVMHFRKTGALTFTGAIAILDPILFDYLNTDHAPGSAWKNLSPTTAGIETISYTPLDGTSATQVFQHTLAGLDGGDPLPASVSLVATLRTLTRGRSYRGRVYTGPFSETSNTAGAPVATVPPKVAGQLNWLRGTGLTATGLSLVVASYKVPTATDVASVTCDSRWDTQRRRLNV